MSDENASPPVNQPPRQAIAIDEPFDVWWPKYLARLQESVAAAEKHLGVPPRTISSIPNDEDYIATVKTYAVVEPILNDLILSCPPRSRLRLPFSLGADPEPSKDYSEFVTALPIAGRVSKLTLAGSLGLLNKSHLDFINSVSRVRNRYAHNVKNMHRSLFEILKQEQKNDAKIISRLTGIHEPPPMPDGVEAAIKEFMYFKLANYLSDALHTLKPPPLPMGGLGLLGGLFGLGEPVREPDNDPST